MSFPPSLPNNPLFPPGFAQPNVPPLPRFPGVPLGAMPVPMVPLSMGVTVPAGVASISAPPVRNPTAAVIAAPPVMSLPPGPPPPSPMIFTPPQPTNPPIFQKPPNDPVKRQNITTVFVGNITDRASDMLIRQLLSKCGSVHNWKRIQGSDGKLQAFGFCDYADPESAMRAIRLLQDFTISDKKLIVKVDAKTQEKLDEYKKNKNSGDDGNDDEDQIIKGHLMIVLKEHETELSKEPDPKVNKRFQTPKDVKNEDLAELDMEDDKRNLIHREIDKFRDTYKKYDEEKERKKDEEKSRMRDRRSHSQNSRSRDRDDRNRSRKSRDRDRRSNRDRRSSSEDDLEKERSESPLDEEELLLRRRRQEQIREKEISYQRRLRDWELREKRKTKEFERERSKEIRRKKEEEIEKQKLKQFLQDYDDSRHDEKFYSGKALLQRQMERRKEIEQDEYERDKERKELDELRKKLSQEGHPDPESEVRKRFNIDASEMEQLKMLMDEGRSNSMFAMDDDSQGSMSNAGGPSVKTFGFAGMKISTTGQSLENAHISNGSAHDSNKSETIINEIPSVSTKPHINKNDFKRKKMTVSEVFNPNDDDDLNSLAKKRRPPPNALLEDSNTDSNLSTNSNNKPNSHMSQEEKKVQIKNLIDKIPTRKNDVFLYVLDWDLLDNNLMEKRIKPWIGKKIRDYLGEEEETLLDFICNKLLSKKSSAQSLLDDVAEVLDEEAQVFVVKLWRLLIYEIEAKKLGLNKH